VRRLGDVVEPDDADVPGNRPAGAAERVDETEGHLVVGGEDGRETPGPGQLQAGVVTEGGRPVAEDRRRHRHVGVDHLEQEALHPGVGLDPLLGPRQVHDVAVAQPDQVSGGRPGAGHLVDEELVRVTRLARVQHHVGDVAGELVQQVQRPGLRRDDDDAVDHVVQLQREGGAEGGGVVGDQAGGVDEVAGVLGRAFHPLDGRRRPVLGALGGQHADGA
jgi:hypothetical protein